MYLANFLADEDLGLLYSEGVSAVVQEDFVQGTEERAFGEELDVLSSGTLIEDVYVDSLTFSPTIGSDRMRFQGTMSVSVELNWGGRTDGASSTETFRGRFSGHFDQLGTHLEDASVDTSRWFDRDA